jgi:type IX secretion system PorP/SprF family membrane protein
MRRLLFIVPIIIQFCCTAQDVHWAQPSGTLLYQNPAFTCINGRFSASLNYRNQWNVLNTSYNSYIFSGDYQLLRDKKHKVELATGVLFYQDVAGDGKLRTTIGGLTIACLVKVSKKVKIGTGMGFNAVQKSLRLNNFTWGSQFDGNNYNPALDNNEGKRSSAIVFADLSAGVSMVYDKSGGSLLSDSKTKFILGYSVSHYNYPNQSAVGGTDYLKMKHIFYWQGAFDVKNNLTLKPVLFFYYQGAMLEATAGCLVRYSTGQQSKITGIKKGSAFSAGLLYRYNDAVVPVIELEKGMLLFGISYDVNVSKLYTMSKLRGGIELSIRLINFADYLYSGKH